MKKLISLVVLLFLMAGCAGSQSNIGDGKFDPKEQAYFKLAVGVAMTARPETAPAVYVISEAVLKVIEPRNVSSNEVLEGVIDYEVEKLKLTPGAKLVLLDLVNLLKVEMFSVLDTENINIDDRLVVVKQMLQIINESARARI